MLAHTLILTSDPGKAALESSEARIAVNDPFNEPAKEDLLPFQPVVRDPFGSSKMPLQVYRVVIAAPLDSSKMRGAFKYGGSMMYGVAEPQRA